MYDLPPRGEAGGGWFLPSVLRPEATGGRRSRENCEFINRAFVPWLGASISGSDSNTVFNIAAISHHCQFIQRYICVSEVVGLVGCWFGFCPCDSSVRGIWTGSRKGQQPNRDDHILRLSYFDPYDICIDSHIFLSSGLLDMFCNKIVAIPSVIRRKFLAVFIQQTTRRSNHLDQWLA
jgi:hypothetical protein